MISPDPSRLLPDRTDVDVDLRLLAPALTGGRDLLLAPFSAATWRAVSQTVIGFVVLLTLAIVTLTMVPLSIGLVVIGVGIPMLVGTLACGRLVARAERARLGAQLGVDIPAARYPDREGLHWWQGWLRVVTDARTWAHQGYLVLGLVYTTLELVVLWGVGSGALALLGLPTYSGWLDRPGWQITAGVATGAVGLWVAALALQSLTLLHVRTARALLGPSSSAAAVRSARRAAEDAQHRAVEAEDRAEHLSTTRTRAVGAADDDRRRIERDLHDGAQQRLVALGVELGTARRAAATDPAAATAALEHAHREVKETLAELRDLVRGIHPAVLTDRGLDAALSALAARSPVPVEVEVLDPGSLTAASPAAQAAAYFVTAEALTNIARHSGASKAHVRAHVEGGTLFLEILDDGHGDAQARPGSGLDGLRSRVEALDGAFTLNSPTGRGTRLAVEVPCAS